MARCRGLGLYVALIAVGSAAPAAASVALVPDAVTATLDGAQVTLTARFTLRVQAPVFEAGFATIALPPTAVVTAGTVTARGGQVRPFALMPTEDGLKAFSGAARAPRGQAPVAVLLHGDPGGQGGVTVDVRTPRVETFTLDLVLVAPTCFYRDVRYLRVPAAWRGSAPEPARGPSTADAALAAACPAREPEFLPPPAADAAAHSFLAFGTTEVSNRRSGDRLGVQVGRLPLASGHVARVELALAGTMSEVPGDLATVIVVDGSRSLSDAERDAQRLVIESYLRLAPRSRVQVVTYARRARALLPAWSAAPLAIVPTARALAALVPANGSNVDAGLAEASAWLGRLQGTRRILLLTDERLADRVANLPASALRQLVPAGVRLHVVVLDRGASSLARDDDAKLGALAAATEGYSVRTGLADHATTIDATSLVRPISIDHLRVTGQGWSHVTVGPTIACGDTDELSLDEGHACQWWGEGDRFSTVVQVEGLVWGTRLSRVITPAPALGRELARELVTFDAPSTSGAGERTTQLRQEAEVFARAVDAHWSLVARWGGRGSDDDLLGSLQGGVVGGIISDTIGDPGPRRLSAGPPFELASQLRPLVAGCHTERDRVVVALELTLAEIVGVTVTLSTPPGTSAADAQVRRTCVEEAMWGANLVLDHQVDHQTQIVRW